MDKWLITVTRQQYSYFFIHRRSDLHWRKIKWLMKQLIKTSISFGSIRNFEWPEKNELVLSFVADLQSAITLPLFKLYRQCLQKISKNRNSPRKFQKTLNFFSSLISAEISLNVLNLVFFSCCIDKNIPQKNPKFSWILKKLSKNSGTLYIVKK